MHGKPKVAKSRIYHYNLNKCKLHKGQNCKNCALLIITVRHVIIVCASGSQAFANESCYSASGFVYFRI